ncbi:HD domain-containing phosphohydrolase [Halodesulfovibrio marinisediminis]|uniref:HD-GYP domain, c-di-GMP phosphodiesterase class II (Or its inactivated variant) n=1 Tax=Halodesulfovibrio marinisediminis DSM 17456 TaxID=1121457 RepID=A0A1N6DW84_9BACT|nr:HD domain-containing phosphohydrolase [Halodesulfovibrio marinisediminis]SIN74963.1 HD-GYP domain, c-di-GMP phosphodiesterase class II (or its inactivated variant) [Halodesulfovibrio marinisediminis DSM 17456]
MSNRHLISFRFSLLGVMIILTILSVGLVIGMQFHYGKELAMESATKAFYNTANNMEQQLLNLKRQARNTVETISFFDKLSSPPQDGEMPALAPLAKVISQNNDLYALYFAYDNGDFYELINVESSNSVRATYGATAEDRWIVIKITGQGQRRTKRIFFLNQHFVIRTFTTEPSNYDPRVRPWYIEAQSSSTIIKTEPYLFSNLKAPGITFAKKLEQGTRVAAVDLSLEGLKSYLSRQPMLPGSQVFLFKMDGEVLAQASWLAESERNSEIKVLPEKLIELVAKQTSKNDHEELTINGIVFLAHVEALNPSNLDDGVLGFLISRKELMRPYMEKLTFSVMVTLLLVLLLAPVVLYFTSLLVAPIKLLADENDKVRHRQYDKVKGVDTRITELNNLSKSMVAMSDSIKTYEQSQRDLMDSFIKLISKTIDYKSPYTGGHCARVPEIATMVARKANIANYGPFKDFDLTSKEKWREFQIAAWLHDCGKVTTPEYIVDKATKLETIYNRIHEVRMRFEVLLRDADIDYWQGLAEGGDPATLAEARDTKKQELIDEFAFIAECNLGGEVMAEDKVERLKQIAKRTWIRHLDNCLGLGHIERLRYPEASLNLPCEEPLLSDRPEHLIERTPDKFFADAKTPFAMEVPEHLYNLGEVYNLSISRGTLTTEDRYKINEHIITTIRMLETLPYPEGLKRIPEYAGAHHETLIGTGYPRKLTAKDISLPARIMTLADVFEALTASDRPYKKAKTLNESVRIMSIMVEKQHLDADLFKLFLETGVYLEYAEKFLEPSQIDEVDVDAYVKQMEATKTMN